MSKTCSHLGHMSPRMQLGCLLTACTRGFRSSHANDQAGSFGRLENIAGGNAGRESPHADRVLPDTTQNCQHPVPGRTAARSSSVTEAASANSPAATKAWTSSCILDEGNACLPGVGTVAYADEVTLGKVLLQKIQETSNAYIRQVRHCQKAARENAGVFQAGDAHCDSQHQEKRPDHASRV